MVRKKLDCPFETREFKIFERIYDSLDELPGVFLDSAKKSTYVYGTCELQLNDNGSLVSLSHTSTLFPKELPPCEQYRVYCTREKKKDVEAILAGIV